MSAPAAIAAQVVDIQNDRQHKGFIKVTVHVPAEQGPRLTEALGWPTYTNPVSVALACLVPEIAQRIAEVEASTDPIPTSSRKHGLKSWHEMPPSQQAGILCGDASFQAWLAEDIGRGRDFVDEEVARAEVRERCNVSSRSEIKVGTLAESAWRTLVSDYRAWVHDVEYVG